MLLAIQFPFTDVRSFLSSETRQLSAPSWSELDPTRDFIRSVGPIRPRRKGAVADWPEEDAFCRVSSAVRFDPSYQTVAEMEGCGPGLRRFCAFRRFVADGCLDNGSVVARLEFGFGLRSRKRRKLYLGPHEAVTCLVSTLKMPVVFCAKGVRHEVPLIEVRDLFDDLYLQSTTQRIHGQPPTTQAWWFRSGVPAAIAEFTAGDSRWEFPPRTTVVPTLAERGIYLGHIRVEIAGLTVSVWLVGVAPGMRDLDLLRRLRINLLRLHAERQSVVEVLRLLRQDKITVACGTKPTENLQLYLDHAVSFLRRETRDGLPQSEMLKFSQDAEELAQLSEREELLAKLDKVRGNLFRNIAAYVDTQAQKARDPVKRDKLFVSYSHKDEKGLEEFKTMLTPAIQRGVVNLWDDSKIAVGHQWKSEISQALASAKVAVLLVSENFLASEFIIHNELPPLLDAVETNGVTIFWIYWNYCLYDRTEIAKYQAAYNVAKPLRQLSKPKRGEAWREICQRLLELVDNP